VNKDPLGEGWLFSMSIDDPSQLGALLTEDEYAAFVR
jgi:glycine cleavage system H lipoate-binding protein